MSMPKSWAQSGALGSYGGRRPTFRRVRGAEAPPHSDKCQGVGVAAAPPHMGGQAAKNKKAKLKIKDNGQENKQGYKREYKDYHQYERYN